MFLRKFTSKNFGGGGGEQKRAIGFLEDRARPVDQIIYPKSSFLGVGKNVQLLMQSYLFSNRHFNENLKFFKNRPYDLNKIFYSHFLHHIRVLCVQFHQNRMTGIRASRKEKDLSRVLYCTCGSGFLLFSKSVSF